MIRIQMPASDSVHNASETPGSGSIVRKMRSSTTACRCAVWNCSKLSPHSAYASIMVCGGSDDGAHPSRRATDRRSASS